MKLLIAIASFLFVFMKYGEAEVVDYQYALESDVSALWSVFKN